mmetsp:Transcript_2669/g.6354  ORF Transcript_2669/g.6354 Transcript_2669/m.6354 type:complete len:192 (-) Transcript_2669:28-603(-)
MALLRKLADKFWVPESASPKHQDKSKVRVLVIGSQNTGRSPFLAQCIQVELPDLVDSRSAGFFAADGDVAPVELEQCAVRHGADLSGHRAASLTQESVKAAEWVIVMDKSQRESLASTFRRTENVFLASEFLPADFQIQVGEAVITKGSDIPNCAFTDLTVARSTLAALAAVSKSFAKMLRERYPIVAIQP